MKFNCERILVIIVCTQLNGLLQAYLGDLEEDKGKVDFSAILNKLKEIEQKLNNFTEFVQIGQDNLEKQAAKQGLQLSLYIKAVKLDFGPSLISAVIDGKPDEVVGLLELGAPIEYQGKNKNRPIHAAVWSSKIEILRILIDHGADINSHGMSTFTPLHTTYHGCVECAKILLEEGAIVDSRDYWEETPLITMAKCGNDEIVKLLLANGADVNAVQNIGYSPLHMAAREGHISTVAILVQKGANMSLRTKRNKHTALDLAIEKNHYEIISYLKYKMKSAKSSE